MAGRLQLRGAGSGSASPRSPDTLTPGPLPPGWQGSEERWLWRAGGGDDSGGVPTEGVAWDPICTLERVATLVSVPRAGW